MRPKGYSILLFVCFQIHLFSQNLSPVQIRLKDSLDTKLKADSTHIFRFQKYRPYINLDQRISFIRNDAINVNGLQFGILIKDRHVIGLGGYMITGNSQQKMKTKTDKNILADRHLSMKYMTFFYQYVAIDKRYIELDLQAELGGGSYNIKLVDSELQTQLLNKTSNVAISGVGPLLAIKPFKWVGIIGMIGYRFTFEKNTNLNFNGAYYSYGVWLDIRQIIRDSKYFLSKKPKYRKQMKEITLLN